MGKRKGMYIYLVRHGESKGNARSEGFKDIPDHALPLTDKGIEQARCAGVKLDEYFKDKKIDKNDLRMWVSPFNRARETADKINESLGLDIRQIREDEMLTEISFGYFDGLTHDEIKKEYPRQWEKYQKDRQEMGKYYARRYGGESALDVEQRLRIFFGTIFRDFDNGGPSHLVIVCHGGLINIFLKAFFHKSHEWYFEQGNPQNCSIIEINVDDKTWRYIHGGEEDEDKKKKEREERALKNELDKQNDKAITKETFTERVKSLGWTLYELNRGVPLTEVFDEYQDHDHTDLKEDKSSVQWVMNQIGKTTWKESKALTADELVENFLAEAAEDLYNSVHSMD